MRKSIAVSEELLNNISTIGAFINDPEYIVGVMIKTSNNKNSFVGVVLQPGASGAEVGTETHFTTEYFVPTDYSLTCKTF